MPERDWAAYGKKYRALASRILVRDDRADEVRQSGLVIPDFYQREVSGIGHIVSIGEKVNGFSIGQRVLFRKYLAGVCDTDDGVLLSLLPEHILAIVPEGLRLTEDIEYVGWKTKDFDTRTSELAQRNRKRVIREAQEKRERLARQAVLS